MRWKLFFCYVGGYWKSRKTSYLKWGGIIGTGKTRIKTSTTITIIIETTIEAIVYHDQVKMSTCNLFVLVLKAIPRACSCLQTQKGLYKFYVWFIFLNYTLLYISNV